MAVLFEWWPDTPDNLPLWEQYGPSLNPAATVATAGVLYMTLPVATQSYIYWHAPAGETLPTMADGSVWTWQVDIDDDGNTDSAVEFDWEPLARRDPFDLDTYWRLSWYSDGSLYVSTAGASLETLSVDGSRTWYRLRRAGDTIHLEHATTARGPWTEMTSRSGYTDTAGTNSDFNFNVSATSSGTGSQARVGRILYETFPPGSYAGVVAADTPNALWQLEENVDATVAVDSISAHDGSYPYPSGDGITRVAGLHTGSTYGRRQDTGDWTQFFGVDPSGDIISDAEFALEVWADLEGTTGGAALLSAGDMGWEAYASVEVNVLGHTVVGFLSEAGGAYVLITYDGELVPGPHHFVLVGDASTLTLYIDAVEVASDTHALDFNGAVTARAMSGTDALTIDSPAVYDHILSPEQVAAHYVGGGGEVGAAPSSGSITVTLPALTGALQAGRVAGNLDATYDSPGARVVLVATDVIARQAWITRRVPGGQAVEVRGSRKAPPPGGFVVHDEEFTSHVANTYTLELRP